MLGMDCRECGYTICMCGDSYSHFTPKEIELLITGIIKHHKEKETVIEAIKNAIKEE